MEQAVFDLAAELIQIKQEQQKLEARSKEIRAQLLPIIPRNESITIGDIRVKYFKISGSKRFNRDVVLQYIRQRYDEVLAEDIDLHCTKHNNPTEQIRITFPKAPICSGQIILATTSATTSRLKSSA